MLKVSKFLSLSCALMASLFSFAAADALAQEQCFGSAPMVLPSLHWADATAVLRRPEGRDWAALVSSGGYINLARADELGEIQSTCLVGNRLTHPECSFNRDDYGITNTHYGSNTVIGVAVQSGMPDSIVGSGDHGIWVIPAAANGSFSEPKILVPFFSLPPPTDELSGFVAAGALTSADVNGDGEMDIVASFSRYHQGANYLGIMALLNNGSGDFEALPKVSQVSVENFNNGLWSSIAVADLNLDGDKDVFFTQGLTESFVAQGLGTGHFDLVNRRLIAVSPGFHGVAVAAADLKGKGQIEAALLARSDIAGKSEVRIFAPSVKGPVLDQIISLDVSHEVPIILGTDLAIGDLLRNRSNQIAVAAIIGSEARVLLASRNQEGQFLTEVLPPQLLPAASEFIELPRMHGEGPDILLSKYWDRARLIKNNCQFQAPECPGDLNGDNAVGQPDLGILLAHFGNGPGGDITGDGVTDQSDLAIVLANYGLQCTSAPQQDPRSEINQEPEVPSLETDTADSTSVKKTKPRKQKRHRKGLKTRKSR